MSLAPVDNNVSMKRYSNSTKPSVKQVATAMASACIPGLGQAINDEWGKGGLFLGGALVTGLLARSCGKRGATAAAIIFGLGQAAIRAYSTVDAALNARR